MQSRIEGIVDELNNNEYVDYAELDHILQINKYSNDPNFSKLWGMENTGQTGGKYDADIDVNEAWDITTGSSNVIVAVIDTGVDYKHSDLNSNMWVNEKEIPRFFI